MKQTLILLFAATLFVGCSTITQQTPIWRVRDMNGSAVFFARNLKVHLHHTGVMSAEGTFTITPTLGNNPHVNSYESWQIRFVEGSGYHFDGPPGTEITSDIKISGLVFIEPQGMQGERMIHQPINGRGYDFVIFRDIQSGKQVRLAEFSASEVMAGDIPIYQAIGPTALEPTPTAGIFDPGTPTKKMPPNTALEPTPTAP